MKNLLFNLKAVQTGTHKAEVGDEAELQHLFILEDTPTPGGGRYIIWCGVIRAKNYEKGEEKTRGNMKKKLEKTEDQGKLKLKGQNKCKRGKICPKGCVRSKILAYRRK
jgi:hypothetical protein